MTSPDGTACIGTRVPVQSRTDDGIGRVDLVDVVDVEALRYRQAGGLTDRGGQRLELAAGPGRPCSGSAGPRRPG